MRSERVLAAAIGAASGVRKSVCILLGIVSLSGCAGNLHCEWESEDERIERIFDIYEEKQQKEALGMKHTIFSVYDQKAEAYLPPFVLHNEGMAGRVFADCCNNPEHNFGKHPEDYSLFRLGTFDDEKGELEPFVGPLLVGTGLEFRTARFRGEVGEVEEEKEK